MVLHDALNKIDHSVAVEFTVMAEHNQKGFFFKPLNFWSFDQ